LTGNDKENCGHCQFQGGIKNRKILCMIDNQKHKTSDTCEHWQEYDSSIIKNDRVQLAISYKSGLQAKKRDEQDKKFQLDRDKADRSFQKKLFIWQFFAGIFLGIIVTIVGQIILKALNLI